jgi:hypothetical protein
MSYDDRKSLWETIVKNAQKLPDSRSRSKNRQAKVKAKAKAKIKALTEP